MRTFAATIKIIALLLGMLVANLTPFVMIATLIMFVLFVMQAAEIFLGIKNS